MLDAAFVNWTSSLTERGFDDAFLSLLRANGYHDVHFTHGAYEFGKDVIAKRAVTGGVEQHAFQSKAGDISGSVWDGIYSQMNELLGSTYTHPNFDPSLRQVRHLVTTGRLVGKAILSAKEFRGVAASRNVEFIVDDQDSLLELLRGLPPTATIASRSTDLEAAVGKTVGGDVTEIELEELLGKLVPSPTASEAMVWRSLLDISVCARSLAARGKRLHSSWALLHGIRLAAVVSHENQDLAKAVAKAAMQLYAEEGASLLAPFLKTATSAREWAGTVGGAISFIVTYPLAAIRVAEYLGFAALFQEQLGQQSEAEKTIEVLTAVVKNQPGVAHPVSDRGATSLTVVIAALAHFKEKAAADELLVAATKWVCDRYEDSEAGLAGPYSSPTEEVRTLMLAHLDGVTLPDRHESLLAVALADLAHVFVPERYEDVLNDVLAVKIVPMAIHPNDHPDAYFVKRTGQTRPLANVRYPEKISDPIPHFGLQPTPRRPELAGGPAVALALGAITRDRLFSDALVRLKPPGP